MRKSLKFIALLAAGAAFAPGVASAETLREALAKAYATNPTMTGARAGQEAQDEQAAIARSRGRPSASTSGAYLEELQEFPKSIFTPTRRITGAIGVDVPLYAGGGIRAGIKAADSRVFAGQQGLRGTEADLFAAVVAAYMDVLRDQALVDLNRNQVKVLRTNLRAARDRFEVGDLTRTDVAQSQARLSRADSTLRTVEAQLIASKERYVQLVGTAPGVLDQPPPLPNLPSTVPVAVDQALSENSDLIAAKHLRAAAEQDVKVAEAARLPRITGVVDGSVSDTLGSLKSGIPGVRPNQQNTSVTAGVQATVPLFQGGGLGAQVRQSKSLLGQANERVIETERFVIAQTRSAYAGWRAANEVIDSSVEAVEANRLALEGVRAENSVGSRTILDILDAEQELLNSEVTLVTARRNAYVAGFQLLALMGAADAADLGLDGGPLYDPMPHYKRSKNNLWDWGSKRNPATIAPRTVDTPAQTPEIQPNSGAK